MQCAVNCLLAKLRRALSVEEDAQPAAVNCALNGFKFDADSWRRFTHFSQSNYTRNLVIYDKQFSVLLLCWASGQKTPVHDHGNVGMKTWVKVLRGELTLQRHESNEARSAITQETTLAENSVLFFDDTIGSHRLRNQQGQRAAVSLHVYTPPMLGCSGVPAVFCQDSSNSLTDQERMSIHARHPNNIIYTNFKSLVDSLHAAFNPRQAPKPVPETNPEISRQHVRQLLLTMRFNPSEWRQYARFKDGRYTRNVVGYGQHFTVVLMCWERNQLSPIHDHFGSNCWIKVLDGQLHQFEYNVEHEGAKTSLAVASQEVLSVEEVSCIGGAGVHRVGNPSSDQVVVSLHVYSPPHSVCNCYDEATGRKSVSTLLAVAGTPSQHDAEAIDLRSHPQAKRARLSGGPESSSGSDSVDLAQFLTQLKHQMVTESSAPRGDQPVLRLLKQLALQTAEWRRHAYFDSEIYTRTLIALEQSFSVVLICWSGGQMSPIHDHGRGTRSWAKVLSGTLEMRKYRLNSYNAQSANPSAFEVKRFQQGECLMECEYTGLHKLGNASTEQPAVSLHIYSPPYVQCCYATTNGQRKVIPAVHTATGTCWNRPAGPASPKRPASASVHRRPAAPEAPGEVSATLSASSAQLKLEMQAMGAVYTDFQSCVNFLKAQLRQADIRTTASMMQGFEFHPEEWRQYSNFQKVFEDGGDAPTCKQALIAHDEQFMLALTCWDPKHVGPPHHQCGSKCWIKVLEGVLSESHFNIIRGQLPSAPEVASDVPTRSATAAGTAAAPLSTRTSGPSAETELGLTRTATLAKGSVTFISGLAVHSIENTSEQRAYSLHLYVPPRKGFFVYK